MTVRTSFPRLSRVRSFDLALPDIAPLVVVFFGGANLAFVQWVMVRELTTLLLGTELVILLISVAYFAGISLGYQLSNRVSRRWLMPLGVVTLVLHLTLPVTFRLLLIGLGEIGAYWVAFLVLPVLLPFIVSAFYSVFLPLFADSGKGALAPLYLFELLGTMFGVGVLFVLGGYGFQVVFTVYAIGLIALLMALGARRWLAAVLALGAGLWLAAFPAVNAWSNDQWYIRFMGFPEGSQVIFSAYSPYQKVDVIQTPDGERALYLDGLSHFHGSFGYRLNLIVGEVPSTLIEPETALVIGGGVLKTEQILASHGTLVTTVEIDPVVADVGARLFTKYNETDILTDGRIVHVDDAKHFIANTDDRYDLIVADTPAALSIQPATLYSAPFYQAIRDRLTDRGIFVGNMTSAFVPGDTVSTRVAASALLAFDEVMVVTPMSVGWSFMFAADDLPFTRAELEAALRNVGEAQFTVFDTMAVRAIAAGAQPITIDSMDFVLQTSAEWISERLGWGGNHE